MEEIFLNLANTLADRIEQMLAARIYSKMESFFRGNVQLCYSEEEAARLLKIEKSTLAQIRRDGEINHYQNGKFATYGIHHLQDFLSRREIRYVPQIYSLQKEISIFGPETESRTRRIG